MINWLRLKSTVQIPIANTPVCLHQRSEPHNEPTRQHTESIYMPHIPRQQSSCIPCRSGSAKHSRRGSICRNLRRRSSRRFRGHVDTDRILSTTGVIRATSALTQRIGTLRNTLIIGFSAGKVWHCLGVLRRVRREAVAAFTHVVEGFLNQKMVSITLFSWGKAQG